MAANKCLQKFIAQETSIIGRVGEWMGEWMNEWMNEWSEYGGKNDSEVWKAEYKEKELRKKNDICCTGIKQWVYKSHVRLTKYTCQDTKYLSVLLLNTKTTLLLMYNNIATILTLL